ncbi:MAG TPA: LuxR C-terminal-related transcriptional regulator [Pseudonocardiaceae bacterium]|jgi:DNA-binding NarL/FixJ family response regulator|nr:LuxR C-terminal-related transcriptional regulator [Pseudonocardiaceae bacterium]
MLQQTRTAVLVSATDPILRNGVRTTLRTRPELALLDDEREASEDTVVMFIADRLDERTTGQLHALRGRGFTRIVLVAGELDDRDVLTAVENGVCAAARRCDTTADVLVKLAVAAAAGEGALPPDLLGRLLNRVSRLQRQVLEPQGLRLAGISTRETDVLRLVAAGLSTREIAEKLCYSQRTVKSILHDVINRFQLRNRSHAVAYALREGLI